MLLSNYILNGGARPYLEFGWVTAPNTAGQIITANTITTLTINTEIADTGNNGSISGNQITLAAGTYYFQANSPFGVSGAATVAGYIFSLRKNVTSTPEIVSSISDTSYGPGKSIPLIGQFTINTPTVFDLTIIGVPGSGNIVVGVTAQYATAFSLATAGADQRTTIKLWKLA